MVWQALLFPFGMGRTSWRSPTSCLKVCRRRFCRRKAPNCWAGKCKQRKAIFLLLLLFQHDLQLCGAVAGDMFHSAWDTQHKQRGAFDYEEFGMMQLPGAVRSAGDAPPSFPHLIEGLVGHHFIQWEENTMNVRRKPGHQFRCQSEYLFATRVAKVGWTGWCEPTPALKAFNGEATSLASEISTWRDLCDVALEFQIRTGEPATIHYIASVLRLPVRITRSMFIDRLMVHMRRRMNLQRTVDFVFYKGRIWPDGSQVVLDLKHCDTFTIMSSSEGEQGSSDAEGGPDTTNNTCFDEEAAPGHVAPENDAAESEHEDAQSVEHDAGSYDAEDNWLFTFITGTEDGIKRFDNFFREDIALDDVFELLAMLVRSDIQAQEVLLTNGLTVDKQRIFIAVTEATDETFLSLQRRFHGYEQESFKILRIRGRVDYEIYSRNFVQEHALEVYLGNAVWATSGYRVLGPGSIVTVLYADPHGGAYSFSPQSTPEGISLLRTSVSRRKGSKALPIQALGNAEEAPWDLLGTAFLPFSSSNFKFSSFSRLAPPGNPDDEVVFTEADIKEYIKPLQLRLHSLLQDSDYKPCGFQTGPSPDEQDKPSIDFTGVFSLWQWLDAAAPDVIWALPDNITWHPSTLPWLEYWWDLEWADQFYIYTDGSAHHNKGTSAAAAVIFARQGPDWFYAGHLRQELLGPACPHRAELHGILLGLHWLNTTLHRLAVTQPWRPAVHFAFDATSAGNKAFGRWGGNSYPTLVGHLRALCYFLEFRYDVKLAYEHVYGHTWDPGNEAANTVAQYPPQETICQSSTWCQFFDRGECPEVHWLWAIWKPEWQGLWSKGRVFLPSQPTTVPTPEVTDQNGAQTTHECVTRKQQFECTLATANVLTLLPSEKECGLQGKTRLDLLQEQFHAAGCHIVGIQESRHKKECRVNQKLYYIFSSPATDKGHFGTQIWISKALSVGAAGEKFEQQHFKIVARNPRCLLLKVCAPWFRAILVCAHAPTSQVNANEREQWWDTLLKLTPHRYRAWPHVLLLDANARVGSEISNQIGSHHHETQDLGGDLLHEYLCATSSWLPSTFEQFHEGPSGTWYHPRTEVWCRGDFVGLPSGWKLSTCQSWVSEEIDLSLTREDHKPACVRITWTTTPVARDGDLRGARPNYDLNLLQELLQGPQREDTINELAGAIGTATWTIDVHTHMHYLQHNLKRWMDRNFVRGRRKPQRRMSDEVWDLVQQKQLARKELTQHNNMLRRRLLQGCFSSWAGGRPSMIVETTQEAHQCAHNLHKFRTLGRLVTAAIRREDKQFFDHLAREAGQMDTPSKCKEFWARIRGALPKVRNKSKLNPLAMEVLDDQWIPHFAKLEAGEVMSNADLFRKCTQRHISPPSMPARDLKELPSRFEIEKILRSLQPGKAAGPDSLPSDLFHHAASTLVDSVHDLYSKAIWWATEPIQSKGGLMFPIHKRGSAEDAANFRGIMLLNVLSKALHKWLRQKVAGRLEDLRCDTQIGGFRNQQAAFGSHCVQTAARLSHLSDQPFACLFVDVQSAYHFLVRELVVGAGDEEDVTAVLNNLAAHGADPTGLNLWLQLPGLLERTQYSPHLTKVLREVHQDTWAMMPHLPQVIRTARGSRPGSPLADIVYAILMFDIHLEVQRLMEANDCIQEGYIGLAVDPFALTWADDLAIPIAVKKNEQVVPTVQATLSGVYKAFERRGLLLNMGRGKTVAVFGFPRTSSSWIS